MVWYAIRTLPGAQMPQREYTVEATTLGKDGRPRGKGYRIQPSLNPEMSAVERALQDAGFHFYMPAKRVPVRDRRKTNHWTTKRFALLPGYVFVEDAIDWVKLTETPGVAGIVGINGVPGKVKTGDIHVMQEAEAAERECVETWLQEQRLARERVSFAKARKRFPVNSTVEIGAGAAKGRRAQIVGAGRDGRLKAIVEGLEQMGTIALPMEAISLVA